MFEMGNDMAKVKRFIQNNNSNAICYYRYSSDAQRDASIDQQRKAAMEYAKAHKLHIVKEYEDRAMSGAREDRPGFQLMLEEVKYLRPAYLILWKTDRLSRDKIDSVLAKKIMRDAGCEIAYVAEAMPEDEAERALLETIQEGLAEHFLIQHRKNVMRGMKYNAENCLYNGSVLLGYIGKPDCRYEIDSKTAPIVKMIYRKYADGVPMKQITDELNAAGMKTVKGNNFTINSLRHILNNRAYIGEYKWGEYIVPDGMPRIIEDSLYEDVQAKLEQNKHGGNRKVTEKYSEKMDGTPTYWLTHHMKCGLCGSSMHGISGTSKQGKLHYYYSCMNHRKHKCEKKNINKEKIEMMVSHILREMIGDSALRLLIAQKCYAYYKEQNMDSGDYMESIQQKISDVDIKLCNIMKAIEAGIFNDTTSQRMKDLEYEKSLLQDELASEEIRQKYKLKLEDVVKYLDSLMYSKDGVLSQQKLLDTLVNTIYTYDDKMIISFNYSIDKKEIVYEQLQDLIDGLRSIDEMLAESNIKEEVSEDTLASLVDNEDPNFFG